MYRQFTHDDFHSDEHTRGVFPLIPVEDTLVRYCHARVVFQFPLLQLCQAAANFHDVVSHPFVHLWVSVSNVVEDVQGKGSVPSPNLVNDEVFVREVFEEIFKHDALRNTLPVPRLHVGINMNTTDHPNHEVP